MEMLRRMQALLEWCSLLYRVPWRAKAAGLRRTEVVASTVAGQKTCTYDVLARSLVRLAGCTLDGPRG